MNPPKLLQDVLKRDGNNFDILRLLAAIAVIIGHSYAIAPQPPLQDFVLGLLHFDYSGSLAVKFFFFLSGLLVTNSIVAKPDAFRFLLKRAFRIFPGLLVCLIISVFVVGPIFTKLPIVTYFSTAETWDYLFHNFFLNDIRWRLPGVFEASKYGLNGSLWTLPYEVLCYIYIAIFYGLGFLKNKWVSNIFFVAVVAFSFIAPNYLPSFFSQNPDAHLLPGCFALGALFAINKHLIPINVSTFVLIWLLVLVLQNAVVYQFLFYVAFFYTTLFLSSLSFVKYKLKLPFDASYGVYVYGFMIQQCVQAVFPRAGVHGNQAISIAIAIFIGILSWYFVEKRFIKWSHDIAGYNFRTVSMANGITWWKNRLGESQRPNKKNLNYLMVLILALVPVIIYFYFFKWKTGVIYGDDLYMFKEHGNLKTLSEKINMPILFAKYRPVHGLSIHLLIELFQKNIGGYYVFNVAIQTINTFLFAFIASLFLRSRLLSLFFGLAIGLSRFSYFNIAQLLNGGALEGLAMTFFLAFLFFLLKALVTSDNSPMQKQRTVIWSMLFANLSMYTHERYVVLFLFVILLIWLYPGLKQLTGKQKITISLIAIASIVLNVVLKKTIYGIPFFVGTASTAIKFSFSDAISFLVEAILAIFQINIGPEYLMGIKFTGLTFFDKLMIFVFLIALTFIFIFYARNVKNAFTIKQKKGINNFWLFVFLTVLFGLCLIPAIVTIRLEQRWLQASYSIFILMIILAYANIPFSNNYKKNGLLAFVLILLLSVDFNYFKKGTNKLYMADAEKTVGVFDYALRDGTIKPETNKLYIWKPQWDVNLKAAIGWELAEGYFFNFYQKQNKEIIYIDTNYRKEHTLSDSVSINFNKTTDQIIALGDATIGNITDAYLRGDTINLNNVNNGEDVSNQHFKRQLLIAAKDMSGFSVTGFYDFEGGFRWTNGNASINFPSNYTTKGTFIVILNTFMPPNCKDVVPELTLRSIDGKEYLPVLSQREGDTFTFKFFLQDSTTIQKINIISATIPQTPPDQRTLSFPFISMEIKR